MEGGKVAPFAIDHSYKAENEYTENQFDAVRLIGQQAFCGSSLVLMGFRLIFHQAIKLSGMYNGFV
jgi:hypothetical protein